ncbi:hypothetical protein LTS15_005724 [Exophiala xenobiotica]|nr:hypothetical protein LTS15_005724 [Exophiala xenobiotica]
MIQTSLLLGLAIGLVLLQPIFSYFRDSKNLRRFPAPSVAAFTNLWAANNHRLKHSSLKVHEAHETLGPIVRIQPKHVSFNVPEAVNDIYGHASKLTKDHFYDTFTGNEYASIVGTLSREDHARKRKYISNAFAQRNVVDMEPIIQEQVSVLIATFDQFCAAPPVPGAADPARDELYNVRWWFNLFSYDAIGAAAFGKPFGFLKQGTDKFQAETFEEHRYETNALSAFHDSSTYDSILAHWPQLLPLLRRLSQWHPGYKGGVDTTAVSIAKIRERQRNGKPQGYTDFFHHLLQDRNGKDTGLNLLELEKEAGVMINAGHDTTATAITNCVFYIFSNPRVLGKLREELAPILGDQETSATYSQVKDLKYLRACLDESMRLRPPTSRGLPRETPPQGATIAGHEIAGGVTVSVPTYTLHRNSKLFKQPEEYRPERWFDEIEGPNCRQYVMPFSQGPRACIGRNLAYLEQQVLIATLVHRYEFQFEQPGYVLPTIERFNANPGEMYVKLWRRRRKIEQPLAGVLPFE